MQLLPLRKESLQAFFCDDLPSHNVYLTNLGSHLNQHLFIKGLKALYILNNALVSCTNILIFSCDNQLEPPATSKGKLNSTN